MKCLAFLAAAIALSTGAMPTAACAFCIGWDKSLPNYDPHYYAVRHEFRRAQWVVKARVLNETWIGEDGKEKALEPPFQNNASRPWGFDPYAGAFYDLHIEKAFKGNPPPVIRVFSENATDRFWLKPGEHILAFVFLGNFDAPIGKQLTLDTCGNFRSYPEANRMMPAIRQAMKSQTGN